MIDSHHGWNSSIKPLIIGFILSAIFIFAAYRVVDQLHLKENWLFFSVVGLGVLQIVFQLIFFLHIGLESKPRWNITMLIFTLLLVAILVFGSLWIMQNLSYNLMF